MIAIRTCRQCGASFDTDIGDPNTVCLNCQKKASGQKRGKKRREPATRQVPTMQDDFLSNNDDDFVVGDTNKGFRQGKTERTAKKESPAVSRSQKRKGVPNYFPGTQIDLSSYLGTMTSTKKRKGD